ncbi:hypothetical protein AB0K14_23695 [Actinosynnema sp. NPDC050801]|uniref:hypothetical protein n=1 Tax=Pseudonocardiaceae TaxID=2070 RepID=UPI001E413895|nr:hypothetical protein [Saccharothrix luteola]MCC8251551.1 hypothetical protein [Saccharothrix luteola]
MRKLTWIAALVGLLLAVLSGGASATAADAAPDRQVHTLDVPVAGTAGAGEAACEARLNNGPIGHGICGTDATEMRFSDGTQRMFIIGLDHAVWNIVQYPNGTQSGWRSLGGWLKVGVYPYIYDQRYSYDLEIWSYGRDSLKWCRALHGSWGAWHRC